MSKLEIKTANELQPPSNITMLNDEQLLFSKKKWVSVESHFKLAMIVTRGCKNKCDKLVEGDTLLCDNCARRFGVHIFRQLKEQDDE